MRPHLPVLLIALSLLGCERMGAAPAVAASPPRSPPAVPVETSTVGQQTLVSRLTAVGSLQAEESVQIATEIAGRIVELAFEEGARVRRGQLLVRLDDSVDRAELQQAEAQRALARRTFERTRELAERRLVSPAEVDNAQAALAVAEAAVALAAARLQKTRITAPFDGVVGLRSVSVGTYVNAGQVLVALEAIDRMKVEFRVPETALRRVAVGQTLGLELDAFPGQRFEAEVYALDARASEDTRSLALRARLVNPDGHLRPGLFARISLDLETRENRLVVPEAAVFPRGQQNFVYAVQDGRAALREVTLGQRERGIVEILSGVEADETVVVSGLQRLSPGAAVQVTGHRNPTG